MLASVRVVAHGLLLLTLSAEAAMVGPAGIFTSRAWQKRGKYTGRPDMPELDDIALRAGVKSPPWNAPRWVWTFAWRLGNRAIPLLHRWVRSHPNS